MWQLITYCEPPAPPRLVTVEIFRRRATQSYAVNLDAAEYSEVDRELRQTIVNCLKHNPKDRPTLEALLDQAKKAVGRIRRDATAGEIRGWVQRYVYDA
ncbi:kinase-like protein [Apiospora saccharicola]